MPEVKRKTSGAAGGEAAAFAAYEKKKKTASKKKTTVKKTTAAKKGGAKRRKKKQKASWWTWPALIFMLLILAGLGAAAVREKVNYEQFVVMRETVDHEGFYDNITIDGVNVAGRSYNDVLSSLSAHEQSLRDNISVTLVCGDQTRTITADELDYHTNYEDVVRQAWQVGHEGTVAQRYQAIRRLQESGANYTVDRGWDASLLKAITNTLAEELTVKARNAAVTDFNLSTLSFSFSGEQVGEYVDPEQLYNTVYTALVTGSGAQTVVVSRQEIAPKVTLSELQSRMGMMSEAKTTASGNKSRKSNIKLALSTLNGVCIQPGEVFSFNGTVGERTEAAGYKSAGAFVDGLLSEEVGGGICQVSSTLYYCAMVSNLKINTRTCHYFPVAYIEPGMDATVSWGGPEFKFTNSREYPIEIKAYVEKNSITVEIWGTDVDGSYVKMSYTANGLRATTYRTVYDKDGNEISRTVEANSTYHSHDTTPTPTPTPSATPTPTPTPQPQPTPYPSVYDPGDAGED